jgi:hypothetical protein
MCTFFYVRMHEIKVDWIEQNEQYRIGQSIMTFNEWYIPFGTDAVVDRSAPYWHSMENIDNYSRGIWQLKLQDIHNGNIGVGVSDAIVMKDK